MRQRVQTLAAGPLGLLALALSLVMALGVAVPSVARAAESIDTTRAGSITIAVNDSNGAAVTGGTVRVYKVADVGYEDESAGLMGNAWYFSGAFAERTDDISSEEALSSAELASSLAADAVNLNYGATAEVALGDTVSLSPSAGLYLVVNTSPARGYTSFAPFLVSVPQLVDGAYEYDVTTEPKGVTATEVEPGRAALPRLRKTVQGDDAPTEKFTFALTALSGAALPTGVEGYVGTSGNTMTLCVTGAGELGLGTVTFDGPGTYSYTLSEVAGSSDGFTYDATVYYLQYVVTQQEGGLAVALTVRDGDAGGAVLYKGTDGSEYVCEFRNSYEKKKPETPNPPSNNEKPTPKTPGKVSRLPKTDDIVLPVAVVVGIGVALVVVGLLRRRHRR